MSSKAHETEIGEVGLTPELMALQQLEEAARFLDLERWIAQRIHQCEREIHLNLQIIRDNGEPLMLRAFRVQHSSLHRPCMGPVIFSPQVTVADVRVLAMGMSWQWALWELPFAGSAGLVMASLDDFSESEVRSIAQQYVKQMGGVVGPDSDVIMPGPEIKPQLMAWMASAGQRTDAHTLSVAAGKPAPFFGVEAKAVSGRLLRSLARTVLRQQGIALQGARIVLAGFDAEAQEIASLLEQAGAKVIAVSDPSGAVSDRSGLNIGMLRKHADMGGMVFEYAEAHAIDLDEMLKIPCDLLILTGGEVWQEQPAARLIFEAGGRLASKPADRMVVPAILAGFGPALAAFAEWRRTAYGNFTEVDVLRGLDAYVRKTWNEVYEYSQKHELALETAALRLAISRMATTMRLL